MAKKKVETVPETDIDIRPDELWVSRAQKCFQLLFTREGGPFELVYKNVAGGTAHFNQLVTADIGDILDEVPGNSFGTLGLTVKKVLEDLAWGMAINRGDIDPVDLVDDV